MVLGQIYRTRASPYAVTLALFRRASTNKKDPNFKQIKTRQLIDLKVLIWLRGRDFNLRFSGYEPVKTPMIILAGDNKHDFLQFSLA